jgi:O-antigen ligase
MTNAEALAATRLRDGAAASLPDRLELAGMLAVFGLALSVQFSIAIAQAMLAIAVLCWLALLATQHERPAAPRFFWPVIGYCLWTLVSAVFSSNPRLSFLDSKQLVLFLVVPVVYRFVVPQRVPLLLTLVMSLGAASAAYGLFQWGLLHYDQMGLRPQGTLGHYMTYSGLLMLVLGIALAKLLFARGERLWAALVMPALLITVALTLSRNAWVGAFAAAAVLLSLKDLRLLLTLPVVGALTLSVAGSAVNARVLSMFNSQDATRVDRVAMLREGAQMIREHPVVGVGPNMVKELYERYRVPGAVEKINPHLHNVPVQIAAERGLPALLLWLAFVGMLLRDVWQAFLRARHLPASQAGLNAAPGRAATHVAAAALAGTVAMIAGGMFEYNFGDSEFLMLFLLIATLPFVPQRQSSAAA